jgi:hypothetical protein
MAPVPPTARLEEMRLVLINDPDGRIEEVRRSPRTPVHA